MLRISARGRGGWRSTSQSRRGFLTGSLVAGGALGLPGIWAAQSKSAEAGSLRRDTAVIQIWLGGGPSHMDMVDLKPDAPSEYRGQFQSIQTNSPGVEICELLPLQAARMNRLAIIRSLHHDTSEHPAGTHWMQTGEFGVAGNMGEPSRPAIGAVTARVRGANRPGMVPYVHIAPDPMGFPIFLHCHEAAYLGSQNGPLLVESARKVADINRGTLDNMIGRVQFDVPNFAAVPGVDLGRLDRRTELNGRLDRWRGFLDGDTAGELDYFQRQALDLVTSGAAREAFDLEREEPRLRERYGLNSWGRGALLCRRLVEAGATFVTLNTDSFSGQWDNHGNLPGQFAEMLPVYDQMLCSLLDDLIERGMYERVLVLVWGEFGRTPRINSAAGRDHWGMSGFAMLGGAGLNGGLVVGSTTSKGEEPRDRPIRPGDVLATVYRVLGIDRDLEFPDYAGRPIKVLAQGEPIEELV